MVVLCLRLLGLALYEGLGRASIGSRLLLETFLYAVARLPAPVVGAVMAELCEKLLDAVLRDHRMGTLSGQAVRSVHAFYDGGGVKALRPFFMAIPFLSGFPLPPLPPNLVLP